MLRKTAIGLIMLLTLALPAAAQEFDVDAYRSFLSANEDVSYNDLQQMHPVGLFEDTAPTAFGQAAYSDSIALKYDLTGGERDLIERHGFMVTERLRPNSFGDAFMDIYKKDLPVFVSTDAILHALHMSYDLMLREIEVKVLAPTLRQVLEDMRAALPDLADRYSDSERMMTSLRDLDVYLTVPLALLSEAGVEPVFSEDAETVQELLDLIEAEEGMVEYPLFAKTCRLLDFSQFTPRGHYTKSPELTRYFRAMMWLGRTEIYLIAPETVKCKPTPADVQRQTIDAALMTELVDLSETSEAIAEIDEVLEFFVGEEDNVTLPNLRTVREEADVEQASALLDSSRWRGFQETMRETGDAFQRINSQILMGGPMAPDSSLEPAAAFMLLGQRFVIDSYITGEVVHEKVNKRMLPSTQDVLFALGNDAAKQFIQADIEQYEELGPRLAALRYLVDGYESEFWQSTLFNGWLQSLRALNPPTPEEREELPAFMQTAAWWQQKMNTQLAGWAQLRHDNLLYAKQSYTGGIICMYPHSFVEPIPAFYEAMSGLAGRAAERFAALGNVDDPLRERMTKHFRFFEAVNDTLNTVARKERDGTPLNDSEQHFLEHMIREERTCGKEIDGWYPRLFFGGVNQSRKEDLVVADIHTSPTDAGGNPVGWVKHAGTGPLNMAVVTTSLPGEDGPISFVGPVMSYYEHVSTNFKRLTDKEWQEAYKAEPSFRPDFVNVYLADREGAARKGGPVLSTAIEDGPQEPVEGDAPVTIRNHPNPFSEVTVLDFRIPRRRAHQRVSLTIYDVQGRRVAQIVDKKLSSGHYTARWDGRRPSGEPVASGAYVARLRVGDAEATRMLTIMR